MNNAEKTVKVEITDKGAIYVDETRITGRSTRWGNHTIISEFTCLSGDLVKECLRRGHDRHVRNIDTEPFLNQKAILAEQENPDE